MQSKQAKHSYTWKTIYQIALEHKKALIYSHFIAILATIASVPVPLLMPLLVDEVLLNKPGPAIASSIDYFPRNGTFPSFILLLF